MSGVLVCGPPRTGTSMVCGLLALHGIWFGDCKPPDAANPKGYFENLRLRAHGDKQHPGHFAKFWASTLAREGFIEGVWGAKIRPEMWLSHWCRVRDVAQIVFCVRPAEEAVSSRSVMPGNPQPAARARRTYDRRMATMDEIHRMAAVPRTCLFTPDLARRDFGGVRPVFEHLGIEFREDLARQWVDPDLWHHR